MKDLWIGHSNTLIDRPPQPGFVDKLGVDITGSSMTDQIRRCRAAAMRALGKTNWPKYYHLVEPTSVQLVADMYKKGQNGKVGMDAYYHLRHVVFDLALSLTYGGRFGEVHDAFMVKFLWSINAISAVRSSTKTYRHFIPILRWIPERTSETIRAERVRAQHVEVLMKRYHQRVAAGETVDCIVKSLGDDKLTEDEIHGTCISLLQAAPDTVASGVYQGVAWLSSKEGWSTQQRAYEAIVEEYGGDRMAAWENAFREERVPLVVSLYKETLRYFTFAPW
jgi:phenylacetate 2-hydroxylase